MEEDQLGTSKPSETLMGFPRYRRSHLKSETFRTLVCILSHCYDESQLSSANQIRCSSQELNNRDNGTDRIGQESQEKESEHLKFTGTDFTDPKDPVPQKETQVFETSEGVGVQGREFSGEFMVGVEEDEGFSRRQDMMICESESVEAMSMRASDLDKEQKLIDELDQIVKVTEKRVCDSGLTPLNLGLGEQQNDRSEFELMDYQVEYVEFQQSDITTPRTESELQVEEESNQHAPEGFHAPLIANISTSTKEQTSEPVISTFSTKHERQQKDTELVEPVCAAMGSFPTIEEGGFEKEEECGQKVPEGKNFTVDQDMNSEALNFSEYGGEMSLLDINILEAKHVMQHEEEQPEKVICANDATLFSNNLTEEGDVEEGEISGDFGMDDNSFDMSSEDSWMLQQKKIDEVQKPKNVIENIVFPFNIQNGEKEENCEPTSFKVHTPLDSYKSGQVEPRTSDKNGLACGVDIGITREIINYGDLGEHGFVLETGKSGNRDNGNKEAVDLQAALAYNQVLHRGSLEEEATKDHQNPSTVKKAGVNCKKKRGPVTEEKKAKKKEKKRKKRAEMNRKLGVKRIKLLPVQKPKTITYCRHYLKGRCHEADKCKFSHDTVPLTKSKPCCHFARHSCMKGDDCPFDHQLSKYPCSNFVTKGSCSRGDACMFSHQMPTKQDISTSSNDNRPESKPQLLLENTNLSKPLNISGHSASQRKCFSNSKGIQSHINSQHEVADTVQKTPTLAPKGISFINVSKSSSLSPSTQKQGMVTPNKESVVQIKTRTDQRASGSAQNLEEDPKKMPVVAPKGINFLSFGKGRVSSFSSSISSFLNRQSSINLSQIDNFGLPQREISSLNKDNCSKVGDGTEQNILQTAPYSNEIEKKNQSVAEERNLIFPGKASGGDSTNGVQCSLTSHQDHSLSRSVQEGVKAYTSQTSTVNSSMLPVSPFVLGHSSERLAFGHHKHVSNSAQRTLLSTLSFAAEHESKIKMKCSAGVSALRSEVNKDIGNNSS